ncbi:hypothetical protein R6V09_12450 [Streptomyces sp. W16]|uniref:hypothetical protein n=1 Tax=Streptomyces sp. W16 TaxID=3076631 RepID=UPI00295C30D1|nr:hypothetical protein [Streptomyces sp. W16]MDV9170942.1 hypothetical protein [Streptomyces sp. W16]
MGVSIPGQPLDATHKVFKRWLGEDYDTGALDAVLSVAASEQLTGDPCWLLVVSGSGAAKTETVMPLSGVGATIVSTITGEAALLSGTAEKEKAKDAHGGLLRKIGDRGLLVIKDVTSILSMNRDARASVLAALREVYDGRWDREIGQDGGKTLTWKGRVVVIGAVTTAWDAAHTVISTMGDRFVLVRIDSTGRKNRRAAGLQALKNVSHEVGMREDLSNAVAALLTSVNAAAHIQLTDDDMEQLLDLADIVTLARTAVERDYQGNVVQAHAPEMPTRFTKQLSQIMRGGIAIGKPRLDALNLAIRCASDSMPPIRLAVLGAVVDNPMSRTADVVKRTQLPRKTADRVLQELHLLGLLTVDEEPYGQTVRWIYTISEDIDPDALRKLARKGDPHPSDGVARNGNPTLLETS